MEFLIAKDPSELEEILYLQETAVGKGVFAKRKFEVGDTIALLTGTLIDDPDYDSCFCIEMGPELSLEPDAPFRFINHSCEPNCCLLSQEDEDGNELEEQLGLYVTTTIYPGEEITIDYAWGSESAIPCLCGSVNCRGWIVCKDEIDDLIEAKRRERLVIVEYPRFRGFPNPEIIRKPKQD